MDPIDYGAVLEGIRFQLQRIADAAEYFNDSFDQRIDTLNATHSNLQSDVRVLKQRGENENVGIVVRHVCIPCTSGLDRAVLLSALKQGGQLQNVLAELANPTPLPAGAEQPR